MRYTEASVLDVTMSTQCKGVVLSGLCVVLTRAVAIWCNLRARRDHREHKEAEL